MLVPGCVSLNLRNHHFVWWNPSFWIILTGCFLWPKRRPAQCYPSAVGRCCCQRAANRLRLGGSPGRSMEWLVLFSPQVLEYDHKMVQILYIINIFIPIIYDYNMIIIYNPYNYGYITLYNPHGTAPSSNDIKYQIVKMKEHIIFICCNHIKHQIVRYQPVEENQNLIHLTSVWCCKQLANSVEHSEHFPSFSKVLYWI